jgi:hypothetical protein
MVRAVAINRFLAAILAATAMALLTGCATANHQHSNKPDTPEPTAKTAAVIDTLTTAVGIELKDAYETNPLGFPMTIVGKYLFLQWLKRVEDCEQQQWIDRFAASIWMGASANNLLIIADVWTHSLGLTVALAASMATWLVRKHSEEESLVCGPAVK